MKTKMAAPMKRHASCGDSTNFQKLSTFEASQKHLDAFLKWADKNEFKLTRKVTVGTEGSCAQYGMVAVEDIEEGELLFQIPRGCLITPETSAIADILQKDEAVLKGSSGWAPVLIALMYEYNNPKSRWRPYLDLVPDFKELDLPMFWSSSEREENLRGTKVIEAVNKDLQNIEKEFKEVVLPFVQKHGDKFSPVCKDIEFYKKMVAFVMAYSFTDQAKHDKDDDNDDDDDDEEEDEENPPPMMVPMADILNHVAKNNAHLQFDEDALRMVAVKSIKKGEEVYNTYGELSNWDLLHMYGFAEPYPDNHYDTVDIPSRLLVESAETLTKVDMPKANKEETLWKQKLDFLEKFGFVGDDCTFVLGVEGVLSTEELSQTIRVMLMSEAEFASHVKEEGWEEEGLEEESLSFDAMCDLPEMWRRILSLSAKQCCIRYTRTMESDRARLRSTEISSRQRFSLHTTQGQKMLLETLLEKCPIPKFANR